MKKQKLKNTNCLINEKRYIFKNKLNGKNFHSLQLKSFKLKSLNNIFLISAVINLFNNASNACEKWLVGVFMIVKTVIGR